jgi:hypothetical protein
MWWAPAEFEYDTIRNPQSVCDANFKFHFRNKCIYHKENNI